MTYDDVMELTIPVMEEIFTGFEESNQESSDNKKTLKGADAMQALVNSGGKL